MDSIKLSEVNKKTDLLPNSSEQILVCPVDGTINRDTDSESKFPKRTRDQAGTVIAKIEQIFESLADCIIEERKELVIRLKSRAKARLSREESCIAKQEAKTRNITFPSRNPNEAWKFVLVRILELSHQALVTGIVTTKRDIYYREPELFKHQSIVDRYLDDIAYTFDVERDALNVVSTAKGLVAGSLTLTKYGCSPLNCSLSREKKKYFNGPILTSSSLLCKATFRTLASSLYWKESRAGKGIIITAKGYPDIQTRKFLNVLSTINPKVPICALMDFDPDGIGIMGTFKYGSIKNPNQKESMVPLMKWLGIRSLDFPKSHESCQGLQILSTRDRRLAMKMLQRVKNSEWIEQLQVMLMLNIKAEIQILGGTDSLCRWLDLNLLNRL